MITIPPEFKSSFGMRRVKKYVHDIVATIHKKLYKGVTDRILQTNENQNAEYTSPS